MVAARLLAARGTGVRQAFGGCCANRQRSAEWALPLGL